MANNIVNSGIPVANIVEPTSRYINSSVLYYGNQNKMTLTTYKRTPIPENSNDKITTIDAGTEYRPDLISQRAYGFPDFWWKIMEANGIYDIFDFKSGLTIRLPSSIF